MHRIQPQIQRTFCFIRKTALRIVDLHGRNAEIRQYKIKLSEFLRHLVDICKIHQPKLKDILGKTCRAQPFDRLFRFDRINIESDEPAFSFQLFQHFATVSAIAQRTVQPLLSRSYFQKIQYLLYHNGNMHARRRRTLFDHMCHCIGIFFRIMFFIFFFKLLRIPARVADTALVYFFFHILPHCHKI